MNRSELPPGPKTKNPLGHLFSFRRNSIGFLSTIAKEYGDIVHFKIGPIRVVLLNHPDYIREVLTVQHRNFVKGRPLEMAKELLGEGLLTSEGDFHKRQSRIIQPAFHRRMIESYAPAMAQCTIRLMHGWEEGMKIDLMEQMMKVSLTIAGKTMFNADLEKEAREIIRALDTASSLFGRIQLPFSEWLLKLPLPGSLRFYKAKARLDRTIYGMIDERRGNKLNNGDLLSLLLSSQDEKGEEGVMNDQQVRDEAITLFLTAFDPSSTALTWTWYLLSQHPEAEAELHEEVDRVLNGRVPTVEDIPQLKYTRMVFGESMRLYPPSYIIPRQAVEDFTIDQYIIPGGTIILMSPYLIHHDSRFHPDPEKFNPHAWDIHSLGQHSKYEYFPFGGGPRSCIGEHFAWMQAIMVIASIAQLWRLKLISDHPVELLQRINLRPKHKMMMTLHRRK
jgi:cytochrome P450